jgi:sec-independent protein translocase protein TatA
MGELLTPTHMIVVAVVAFVLFGETKLPEFGKGLGEGLRGFKDAIKGLTDELDGSKVAPTIVGKHAKPEVVPADALELRAIPAGRGVTQAGSERSCRTTWQLLLMVRVVNMIWLPDSLHRAPCTAASSAAPSSLAKSVGATAAFSPLPQL